MATIFPAPPPTTNTHSPTTRTRFIRSARKLSVILGTTPLVTDVVPPVPALPNTTKPSTGRRAATLKFKSRRQASIFAIPKPPHSWEDVTTPSGVWTFWNPSAASVLSDDSSSARSSEESTRSLPAKLHTSASLVHLPLFANSDASDSDSSFTPATRKANVFRRHRARPPPLRLHVCLPPPKHTTPHHSYFSPDTAIMCRDAVSDEEDAYSRAPLSAPSPPANKQADDKDVSSLFTPVTPAAITHAREADRRVRKMEKVNRMMGENVSPSLVFGREPSKASSECLSPSLDAQLIEAPRPVRGHRPTNTLAGPPSPRPFAERRRSASVSMISDISGVSWVMVQPPAVKTLNVEHLPERSRSPAVRREESNWTGEWSVGDMDTVRHRLRSLKAR